MNVMLTSCGLETDAIQACFTELLKRSPAETRALFIPTAAIDADAIAVLPKCMNDLLKCGIPKENITVFDLHRNMPVDELLQYDAVYLCGGRTSYLLERINASGFRDALLAYIRQNGLVIGVSAGSIIFADNLPGNLQLLPAKLDVHCPASSIVGRLSSPLPSHIRLSNYAAMIIRDVPDDIEILDIRQ